MPNYMITSIVLLIVIYPFIIYFQLKSFSKALNEHWQNIEKLLSQYENTKSEQILEKINVQRRAYNSLVRANEHKLDSIVGRFIANKYGFEKREYFNFKD